MQCSNCGEDILNGADFCGICGTPVGPHVDSPSISTTGSFVISGSLSYYGGQIVQAVSGAHSNGEYLGVNFG